MSFLATDKQRTAIEHLTGPMLVVAGAGSGKTSVLVQRIAHLIGHHKVDPTTILALTFTDNAAKNLKTRVTELVGTVAASQLQARTFHSYCAELLKICGKDFDVVDEMDLKVYLNLHVRELPLKLFIKAAHPGQFIEDLLAFNSRCQDELVSPEDYRKYVSSLMADSKQPLPRVSPTKVAETLTREDVLARCQEVEAVYRFVSDLLRKKGWGTYGQMIMNAVEQLRDPKILAEEQQHSQFVLIDEFQDSNFAQIELAQLLAGKSANIFAVGDPDQGVYRFRGASSEAFEEFRRRFPKTKNITLDANFRSVPEVLQVAFEIISKNQSDGRLPLVSARSEKAKAKGEPLPALRQEILIVPDEITEAKTLLDGVEERKNATSAKWSDFAVLYRSHKHREQLVHECVQRSVPHDVTGVNVLSAPESRDLLAAIRATVTPNDSVSLFRLAALPHFGIKPEPLKFVLSHAKRESMMEALLLEVPEGKKLLDTLNRCRQQIANANLPAPVAVDLLIKMFLIPPSAVREAFRKFVRDWQNKPIAETKTFQAFSEYLETYISLSGKICLQEAESDDQPDAVRFMTIHAAKGLEFKHVNIIRLNSGSFPMSNRESLFEFPRALLQSKPGELSSKQLHDQEERRLFYVALTRAEDSLTLYCKRKGESPTAYAKELIANKALANGLTVREVPGGRFDLQASAAAFTPIASWLAIPSRPPEPSTLTLSASALESYDQCPLRYKIEREWRLPGELGAAQQFGATIHLVLRAYYDAAKAGNTLPLEAVIDCFRDAIQNAKIADHHQLALYTEQGVRQLTAFVESRKSVPPPKVLATEKSFVFEIAGVKVQGRIDRIDELSANTVAIEDYKTGAAKTEKHADESLQLSVYALAARSEGKRAERLSLYSLENNTLVSTQRSSEDLQKAEEKIAEIAEGIRQGLFDAQPGYHCSWCPYTSICPAKEERLFQISRAAGMVQ